MTEEGPAALLATLRSALSHELAQPLAVARGYVELLESRDEESMRKLAPPRIREAVERAALLVDDLVRLIEFETGADVAAVPGPAALADARERVAYLAEARQVTVKATGEPGATDTVALGAVMAAAVERAARGSTVLVESDSERIRVAWEGEALAPGVASRIESPAWRGDAASLCGYLARRRLARLEGALAVGERQLELLSAPPAPVD